MRSLWVTAAAVLWMACGVPNDPEDTFDRIRSRGAIRVGVVDAPPWIDTPRQGETEPPAGVEADLILDLARQQGLDVRWYRGAPEEHFAALEHFDLDLVAGGITASTPWKKHVGTTRPFVTSRVRIGSPPGSEPLSDLEGQRIAVRTATGWETQVRQRGAEPVVLDDPYSSRLPVAAPEWELRAKGYTIGDADPLAESKHVLAVPPGENRWLAVVEEHLASRQEEILTMLITSEKR